jgi:hypothetical protein
MKLYYTSISENGGIQTRPDLSLGGFKSGTVVPNNNFSNLFSDLSAYSIAENKDEYIALVLLNDTGFILKNVSLYFVYPIDSQKSIQIAPVAFNSHDEIEIIPNPFSAPYNAIFYEADGETNAIDIGDIPIDGKIGLWFKRVIDKSAITDQYSDDNMVLNGNPVVSDEAITLNISCIIVPTLSTIILSSITQTTAVSGGNPSNDGDDDIISKGICWSTLQNPTIDDDFTDDGDGLGSFVSNITGLTGNTVYYVRSYATNSAGTGYGNQLTLLTAPVEPTVNTTSTSNIATTSVTSGGNVTSDGGSPIIQRGVCWSTITAPTTDDSITSNGTGTGIFISSVTGLVIHTIYYLRVYAINSIGISYGNEVSFTTL